ncbi:hypothetical protein A3C23_01855 [Candidatus Roizmanbacteria bacterium RIFCSPHIGHO2_02_FULL_37_13b]|uniref:VanZ-like domain-containing protein n=1 Tax=Candidatus Roizmanbacteria bacterium RIFCSPLOWO2_02_FULL_36_11 TaxID=1802071 RepID=A0A1F7JBL4_9BACT|nr:MAG: hypothetical protein A3C23_01855 [Candidatus Roizmanbacteria bacterium RIFCSPHIGHO2_02_FULL_37_13b]OGK52997.1 MAG: hypothetical protein A3H78_02175 [Candidatus Roizmanbacteria bacterium RIFCSPLOWO2_02_FULL_36_11]
MSSTHNKIIAWLPASLWMALIFILSSRPKIGIMQNTGLDFIIFKSLHVIEYAILFFLIFRALHKTSHISVKKQFIASFLIAFFYAVSDEFHQTFVPSREGRIRDIFIDSIGISLSFAFIKGKLDLIFKYF